MKPNRKSYWSHSQLHRNSSFLLFYGQLIINSSDKNTTTRLGTLCEAKSHVPSLYLLLLAAVIKYLDRNSFTYVFVLTFPYKYICVCSIGLCKWMQYHGGQRMKTNFLKLELQAGSYELPYTGTSNWTPVLCNCSILS